MAEENQIDVIFLWDTPDGQPQEHRLRMPAVPRSGECVNLHGVGATLEATAVSWEIAGRTFGGVIVECEFKGPLARKG